MQVLGSVGAMKNPCFASKFTGRMLDVPISHITAKSGLKCKPVICSVIFLSLPLFRDLPEWFTVYWVIHLLIDVCWRHSILKLTAVLYSDSAVSQCNRFHEEAKLHESIGDCYGKPQAHSLPVFSDETPWGSPWADGRAWGNNLKTILYKLSLLCPTQEYTPSIHTRHSQGFAQYVLFGFGDHRNAGKAGFSYSSPTAWWNPTHGFHSPLSLTGRIPTIWLDIYIIL